MQEQLAEAGVDSRAPTLPGHGGADRALEVRHAHYVSAVLDSLPPQFIDSLDQAAAASPQRTIALPDQLIREAFANTANEHTLAKIAAQLVAEPPGADLRDAVAAQLPGA